MRGLEKVPGVLEMVVVVHEEVSDYLVRIVSQTPANESIREQDPVPMVTVVSLCKVLDERVLS